MLSNLRNGIFAIGIFVGVVFTILGLSILSTEVLDLEFYRDFTFLVMGAILALLGSWFIFNMQITRQAVMTITAIQVKFNLNMLALQAMKFEYNRCSDLRNKNGGDFPPCFYLSPTAQSLPFTDLAPEELALIMDLLSGKSKVQFMQTWVSNRLMISQRDQIVAAINTEKNAAGFPNEFSLSGSHTVDPEKTRKMIEHLSRIDVFLKTLSEDAGKAVAKAWDQLYEIQEEFRKKTGKLSRYQEIVREDN